MRAAHTPTDNASEYPHGTVVVKKKGPVHCMHAIHTSIHAAAYTHVHLDTHTHTDRQSGAGHGCC